MSKKNNHINYVEFRASDLEIIKKFYQKAFDWEFTDYGPGYTAFHKYGIEGGFEKSDERIGNGALVILYHDHLKICKQNIIHAGGEITKDIFDFPGGKRFHFKDPAGNELAVWSDK